MIFEIIVCMLLAVASIGLCCTTALAWLILKVCGEMQHRLNNPIMKVDTEEYHG